MPLDVEERLLLPRERRVGQILRGRGGPDRERGVRRRPPTSCSYAVADVGLQVCRERLGDDRVADLLARPGRARCTSSVSRSGKPAADLLGQAGVADEPAVGVGGRGEPVRHPHPGRSARLRHHLPQRGVLPADLLEVGQAELGEPEDVVMVLMIVAPLR